MSLRKEHILDTAMVVLTMCAVTITGLVVRRELFETSPPAAHHQSIQAWREFARYGHRMGSMDAPVAIVVFSDFQCPFCAVLTHRLDSLRRERPREIAIIYRHFPLAIHRQAAAAVRASECAASQGRFEAFHNLLFSLQDSIGILPWDRFAVMAGLQDTAAFRECVALTEPIPSLARDTLAGRQLAIRGTPTLLINDLRLEGAQPMDTLRTYIARALNHPH